MDLLKSTASLQMDGNSMLADILIVGQVFTLLKNQDPLLLHP